MNVRARVAFASGVAGAVGAALLLTGRFEGSAILAMLYVWAAKIASPAALLGAGPVIAPGAARHLTDQLRLAPAWALIVAVGVIRAGSVELIDVRGANAVAGLALVRGPLATVVGAWLAVIAGALAVTVRADTPVVTAGAEAVRGIVTRPAVFRRLDIAAAVAQVVLVATLFVGPQVDEPLDGLPWVAAVAGIAGVAIGAQRIRAEVRAFTAGSAGAVALALALIGGSP